jgi:N-glycosylase/DNA lyase
MCVRAAHPFQVLFTADLKSFASYGLSTSSPSPEKVKHEPMATAEILPLATPPSTKRKRASRVQNTAGVPDEDDELPQVGQKLEDVKLENGTEANSLAGRVKQRRRVSARSQTNG